MALLRRWVQEGREEGGEEIRLEGGRQCDVRREVGEAEEGVGVRV